MLTVSAKADRNKCNLGYWDLRSTNCAENDGVQLRGWMHASNGSITNKLAKQKAHRVLSLSNRQWFFQLPITLLVHASWTNVASAAVYCRVKSIGRAENLRAIGRLGFIVVSCWWILLPGCQPLGVWLHCMYVVVTVTCARVGFRLLLCVFKTECCYTSAENFPTRQCGG